MQSSRGIRSPYESLWKRLERQALMLSHGRHDRNKLQTVNSVPWITHLGNAQRTTQNVPGVGKSGTGRVDARHWIRTNVKPKINAHISAGNSKRARSYMYGEKRNQKRQKEFQKKQVHLWTRNSKRHFFRLMQSSPPDRRWMNQIMMMWWYRFLIALSMRKWHVRWIQELKTNILPLRTFQKMFPGMLKDGNQHTGALLAYNHLLSFRLTMDLRYSSMVPSI